MKRLKNKPYWILMPPFLILSFILIYNLPPENQHYAYIPVIVFWIVYYSWNLYSGKKNRNR
ncbi:hypothetical protein [Bacillus sp. KH172YL63]|uniref:hypothetical protein n=1 Tax=Bacillus sp. KH172YL63 TaxID=2709784 RepID=UPI0013E51932|nr:hypothetical protein [Bacillus sp. KH172YL63]BCB02536.1 hypothetical protein KH172YL63_06690 [Bacillus sp. KH172YL63]